MAIDWFTLVAQLLNFTLLVVLLRVFLYRPVLAVMDERAALTAAALTEARELSTSAAAELSAVAEQRAALAQERGVALAAMAQEVEDERERRLMEVTREAAAAREASAAALEKDLQSASEHLRRRVAELVIEEVRTSLRLFGGGESDHAAGGRPGERSGDAAAAFAARLKKLPRASLDELRAAAARGGVPLLKVAQPLDKAASDELTGLISRSLGAPEVRVELEPELLLGATLEVGGRRIDGSLQGRLQALEQVFKESLAAVGLRSGDASGEAAGAERAAEADRP